MQTRNKSLPSTRNQNRFAMIPEVRMPRSTFDRSSGLKTTMRQDFLTPVFVDEALPGDTWSMKLSHFARMTTPLVPLMDNMHMSVHFFSVPVRLIWDNWQKFNGEQLNPGDSTDFLTPKIEPPVGGWPNGSLADHFGLPTEVDCGEVVALPFRAWNLIYNEWYRDENITDSIAVPKDDGPDDPADYYLIRRGKRKDYFTSALPFAQKGDPVQYPIGGLAPIEGLGLIDTHGYSIGSVDIEETAQGLTQYLAWADSDTVLENFYMRVDATTGEPRVYADLAQATAGTINQLREAFQMQKLFERDARTGTRYTEILRGHFGVDSDDARLQRPELIGFYSARVNVNPIAQTSETASGTPQGNLAAVVTSANSKGLFSKSFNEHCYVIGICSFTADLTYQQGIDKMWLRSTRFDFYWPTFAHLGEQAILSKELYCDGTTDDELVFGYQERYAEYRFRNSKICGQFRSNFAQSLDFWHLSQDFGSRPSLNNNFILSGTPMDRVLAVADYPDWFVDMWFDFKCTRPMPAYSEPGMIDHF